MMKKMFVAAGLVLATTSAMAADGKGFLRAEGGRTDFSAFGGSTNDTAASIRGGYYFNHHFGIEGFYTRYGSDSADGVRLEADGIGLGVFGKANFGAEAYTGFYFSGRAGVAHDKLDVEVSGLGSADDTDTVPYVGVGVGYDFNHNFGMGLQYDYQEPKVFDTRFKVETLTLGLEYRF
jgi:OOP family OmpA-OmpF porin